MDDPRTWPFFYLKRSMHAARALAGLSQDKLAALSGLRRQTIILMEDTNKQVIPFADLERVRAVLEKIGIMFIRETEEFGPAVAIKAADFISGQMRAIGAARELLELRQDQLAELAGTTRQMISRIERSDTSVPIAALVKIRNALEREGVAFLPGIAESGPCVALRKKPRLER